MTSYKGALEAQLVKKPPAIQETQVQSLAWEDPLNKGMETAKYSCLEMPWTEKSISLQSRGSQ